LVSALLQPMHITDTSSALIDYIMFKNIFPRIVNSWSCVRNLMKSNKNDFYSGRFNNALGLS